MSVTLERLSTVAQELIFISKNFTQVDGEKVVLDVPGNGAPIKTASSDEGWLHKIFENVFEWKEEGTFKRVNKK